MDEDYFSQTDFRWQRKWRISHFARARCYGWEGSFKENVDFKSKKETLQTVFINLSSKFHIFTDRNKNTVKLIGV